MRRTNKFKNFNNVGFPLRKLPNKLSTFYRPKWQILKLKIKETAHATKVFVDPSIIKVHFRHLDRLDKHYQIQLGVKKHLAGLFDQVSLNRSKSFSSKKKDLILKHIVTPLYRLDILLWYLNIFSSVYQVRQFINSGNFKVNNLQVNSNYLLKKGDVISTSVWLNGKHDINYFDKIYLENILFLTFLEVDYYTKTISIIKNQDEMSADDYKLLADQYINVYKGFN